mgnify:FL=1
MRKKYEKRELQKQRRERMVESLSLPKYLVLGSAILTVTGNSDLYIENYKGILLYEDCCILLQTKTCQVQIEGCNLSIDYYNNEDMRISGCIRQIVWK